MHETITTQDSIRARQWIARDVGQTIGALHSAVLLAKAQIINQVRHDIDPGIGQVDIEIRNPAAIAAGGIEKRRRSQPAEQLRKLFPQVGGGVALRSKS